MDENTKNVYNLIVKRFLAIFFPPAVYNTVRVETVVNNEIFVSNAKTLKEAGWKEVYEVSAPKQDEELTEAPIHLLVKMKQWKQKTLSLRKKRPNLLPDIPMVHW